VKHRQNCSCKASQRSSGCARRDLTTAFFFLEKSHKLKGNYKRITSGAKQAHHIGSETSASHRGRKMGGGLRKSLHGFKTNVEQREDVDKHSPWRFSAQPEVDLLRAELVVFWERIAEMERRGYTGPAMRTLKIQAVKLSVQIEELYASLLASKN
jgi:hypothetical protein